MSIREPKAWITGDEFGEARRRLLVAGFKDDSPEMQNLLLRVRERDEYLWQHFAKPHIDTHRGQWAAVGLNGEILFGPTASAVMADATDRFGTANFVLGRLAEFRGRKLHRC